MSKWFGIPSVYRIRIKYEKIHWHWRLSCFLFCRDVCSRWVAGKHSALCIRLCEINRQPEITEVERWGRAKSFLLLFEGENNNIRAQYIRFPLLCYSSLLFDIMCGSYDFSGSSGKKVLRLSMLLNLLMRRKSASVSSQFLQFHVTRGTPNYLQTMQRCSLVDLTISFIAAPQSWYNEMNATSIGNKPSVHVYLCVFSAESMKTKRTIMPHQ